MKIICFAVTLFFVGCFGMAGSRSDQSDSTSTTNSAAQNQSNRDEPGPASFSVKNFILRLMDDNGNCVLQYRLKDEKTWQTANLGMKAPCDFIGRKVNPSPEQFVFNKGKREVSVLLVTGGPSHPEATDEFMPRGCGTQLATIRVYLDHVDVEAHLGGDTKTESEPVPYCPSNPLDQVFFAT